MEDKGYRGDDTEEDKDTSLKPEGGFLASWLIKKEAPNEHKKETKDDEERDEKKDKEDKLKKSSLLGRFLRGLMGGSSDKTDEKLGSTQEINIDHTHSDEQQPEPVDQEDISQITPEEQPIRQEAELADQNQQEVELTINHGQIEQPTTPNERVDINSDQEIVTPITVETRVEQPIESPAAPEINIPVRPTGVEYGYAGQNERKLKREIKRMRKRVTQQETATKRIKEQAKQADEQLNVVKSQQLAFEAKLVKQETKQKTPELNPEQTVGAIDKQPSTQEKLSVISQQSIETITKLSSEPEKAIPTDVLQTVVEAADRDIPLEREFERRHEVKDDTTIAGSYGGAIPVSSILQSNPKNYAPPIKPPVPTIANPQNDEPHTKTTVLAQYSQAISGGFIAAIILLSIVILLSAIF